MPKKNSYVCAACHAKQCGNYDRLYKNHCRARSGEVPLSWQDCWAFMTEDEAIQVDSDMQQYAREHDDRTTRKHWRKEVTDK